MSKTKFILAAAAVSMAFALPALAQDTKSNLGAPKPVETDKPAAVATPTAAPAAKPGEVVKAPDKTVTPVAAPAAGTKPAEMPKTEAPKTGATTAPSTGSTPTVTPAAAKPADQGKTEAPKAEPAKPTTSAPAAQPSVPTDSSKK